MPNIQGTLKLATNFNQASPIGFGVPLYTEQNLAFKLPNVAGTAGTADNADLKYSATLILAGTPTAIDLTALTDVYGNAVSFERIRSITMNLTTATDGHTVKVGYATSTTNAFTGLVNNGGQLTIYPSSSVNDGVTVFLAPNTTGMPVTSSNKLLNFDPGANTVTLNIEILGCSA